MTDGRAKATDRTFEVAERRARVTDRIIEVTEGRAGATESPRDDGWKSKSDG
ncbi:hypothetical protein ACIQXF_05225 [Lysinibacillus sp. NPDC097231]|uniref:hypothetical protein n=1 Tax=Lysinibacillus sp. NPDC097231 TaxID=3364142 RepID=UPI003811D53C